MTDTPPNSSARTGNADAPNAVNLAVKGMATLSARALKESWGLLVALALLVLIFSLSSPYFFNAYAAKGIIEHAAFTLILATGMTLVIATGGIDVSVGATLAVTSMVTALAMTSGVPVWVSVLLGFATGAVIGMINGVLVSSLKLQSFIVTLAMLSLARGMTLILSDGYSVSNLPESFGDTFSGGSPSRVVLFGFGVLLATMFVLHRTRYGIQIRSIGGNETTSYICGVRVNFVRVSVYVFQAILAVLAGLTLTASFDAAEPTAGLSTEWLEAIAAPIIGGNALAGGRARLFGTLIGCFILSTMRSGLNISGVPVAWQQVAIGTIIVGAVAIDAFSSKRKVAA